jgi:hypothetical protein
MLILKLKHKIDGNKLRKLDNSINNSIDSVDKAKDSLEFISYLENFIIYLLHLL